MSTTQPNLIQNTLQELFQDAKTDKLKMMKGVANRIFGPLKPSHFKDVYLSISKEQGDELIDIIRKNSYKNIVEFGTSFGISTLYLAEGVRHTEGQVITTELLESKALRAAANFKKAGVSELIEIRTGDAMSTLKNHEQSIDLLLLDGWKDLYLPLFRMLEKNFNKNALVYVDNADMSETRSFLQEVRQDEKYHIEHRHGGKVAFITLK